MEQPHFHEEIDVHEETRRRLAARYGISGEYVGAAAVARILGIGLTTVYEQANEGRFVIPHRLANRKPLFLLDDLVTWMVGERSQKRRVPGSSPAAVTPTPEPAHVFEHADAEAAFQEVMRARGIRLPKSR